MPARPSLSDSPWFWAYLFGVAALIGAVLVAPKYGQRQAQIEREYQGRERALELQHGQAPQGQLSTPRQTIIPLRPLLVAVAIATAGAWLLFWRSRQVSRPVSASPEATLGELGRPRE